MSAHFSRKKVGCSGWMDRWVGGWVGGWAEFCPGPVELSFRGPEQPWDGIRDYPQGLILLMSSIPGFEERMIADHFSREHQTKPNITPTQFAHLLKQR